jgi:trk system potassium uptake protein TrkH
VRDGFLLVVLVWAGLPAFATVPLLVYFWPRLSFTDAYFEAVSSLTTTGATVLEGLDALPYSINLWRAELVWLGGMGLIVLAVAILPLLGVGGRQLFKAEAPGPMKDAKLTPRMAETAKGLWLVYFLISAACLPALAWAGMGWGDALIHTFTVMGLGGFSSHDASFGFFDSATVEAVTIFFMTLAGMNFATHFLALRNRSFSPYRFEPEVRWFLFVMYASVLGIAWYLWEMRVYPDFWTALRYSAFNVVSIATTTGYANTDYNQWPIFAPLWMLFLCSFVTCSGSTGGGIKMMRAILLYKQVHRELVRAMHPNAVHQTKLGADAGGEQDRLRRAGLRLHLHGEHRLHDAAAVGQRPGYRHGFSAVVALHQQHRPGLQEVGPATTFAVLSDFQTWVCSFAMLLGRLGVSLRCSSVLTPGLLEQIVQ